MNEAHEKAFLAALRRLGRRDYFETELEAYLRRKGFGEDAIEAAVERCRELDYVDDRRLGERFARDRAIHRAWSPRRIRHALRARGVADEVAEETSRLPDELVEGALCKAARRAELRGRPEWWRAGEGRARMVSSLIRSGFHPDDAHRTVSDLAAQREASEHAEDDQSGDPNGVS